jgi:2-haloacid dehalogenase
MTDAPLRGVRACVFDAYGTVFDFASAADRCTDALGDTAARLTALWRDKQLQYSWLRAAQDRHADFWQVTGDALDFALETMGLVEPGLRDRLMQLYLALDPFPEVPEVLQQLRATGFATAILSNGSPQMLAAAIENGGSPVSSIMCFRWRRSGSTSRTRKSTGSPATGSRWPPAPLPFSPPTPGMPTPPRPSA